MRDLPHGSSGGEAAFWRRFTEIAPRLGVRLDDRDALREPDEEVERLGDFDWEVGPGPGRGSVLALSPRGSAEKLRQTRRIVSGAPAVPGWTFLPALPPKEWTGTFIYGVGADERNLHSAEWRAVVFRYPDRVCDVQVHSRELAALDESDAQTAARLAVTSWIGEEMLIERVHQVEACGADLLERGIPLPHLSSLLSRP